MNVKEQIAEIAEKYPELIFNNKGYEYLPKAVQEKYKTQINQINEMLKPYLGGYKYFNNFKLVKDKDLVIRYQYDYNYCNNSNGSFIGVGYIFLKDIY